MYLRESYKLFLNFQKVFFWQKNTTYNAELSSDSKSKKVQVHAYIFELHIW